MAIDFLPICDLLFNFISVASYFCDVAFDILTLYSFYGKRLTESENSRFYILSWGFLLLSLTTSVIVTQIISFRQCLLDEEENSSSVLRKTLIYALHATGLGILWRYSKLFSPIDIHVVKREMGNLCVLRMIHAFVQAWPFLLIQGYLLALETPFMSRINYISLTLSLFNICWSVASFNKNIRPKNVHKLVLTWIGVIFQFIWRLGCLSSRSIALLAYSSVHGLWILLPLLLHWCIMFTWIQGTSGVSCHKSWKHKLPSSLLLSYIYIFTFINITETDTKFKIVFYYLLTFSENLLLTSLWFVSLHATLQFSKENRLYVLLTVIFSFLGGLVFMLLYYTLFHVSKLKEESQEESKGSRVGKESSGAVFNCALNSSGRRKKKKKIPSIIPLPPNGSGKTERPFWKEPLPSHFSSMFSVETNEHLSYKDAIENYMSSELSNISSGDQGDVESEEDNFPRICQRDLHTYETPL